MDGSSQAYGEKKEVEQVGLKWMARQQLGLWGEKGDGARGLTAHDDS